MIVWFTFMLIAFCIMCGLWLVSQKHVAELRNLRNVSDRGTADLYRLANRLEGERDNWAAKFADLKQIRYHGPVNPADIYLNIVEPTEYGGQERYHFRYSDIELYVTDSKDRPIEVTFDRKEINGPDCEYLAKTIDTESEL